MRTKGEREMFLRGVQHGIDMVEALIPLYEEQDNAGGGRLACKVARETEDVLADHLRRVAEKRDQE